jgi:hypothetical protein
VLGDQRGEHGHELGVPAECELCVVSQLDGAEARILETLGLRGDRLARAVGER